MTKQQRAEQLIIDPDYPADAAIEALLPDTPFQRWLSRVGACAGARVWAWDQTLESAWARCQNAAWMRWLTESCHPDTSAIIPPIFFVSPTPAGWRRAITPVALKESYVVFEKRKHKPKRKATARRKRLAEE